MGYSIHAETIEELLAHADALRAYVDPAALPEQSQNEVPVADVPAADKPKRTRKKAEAPDPIMPESAPTAAATAPASNPFMAPQQPAPMTFVPAPEPAPVPFTPPAPEPIPSERPSVVRAREQLELLGSQHGRQQVYTWAIKALGLSPSLTIDDFIGNVLHQQADESLDAIYRQAGGKL